MKPLVSIVIPTYNRARELARAISSVLGQTYQDWEVMIVDNHSDDDTDDVVKSFNDSRLKIYKINNVGIIAASRNLGISRAKGEYIAFLDSDDWWVPGKLELSVKCLESGNDVVYHNMFLVNKPNPKVFFRKTKTRSLKTPVFSDLITNGNVITTSSVVIRKRILDKVGGMSEDRGLIAIEDFDTWIRVAKVTEKFECIHDTLGCYWVDGNSYWSVINPIKVNEKIEYLKSLYADDFVALYDQKGYWAHLIVGYAYFRNKNYAMSKKYLEPISELRMPWLTGLQVKLELCYIDLVSLGVRNENVS